MPKALEPNWSGRTSRITGRARTHKRGRPPQLCALRLIRLFGSAENPNSERATREEQDSGREATPCERTVDDEHVEGRRSGRSRGATPSRVPSRAMPRIGPSARRATWREPARYKD